MKREFYAKYRLMPKELIPAAPHQPWIRHHKNKTIARSLMVAPIIERLSELRRKHE